MASLLMDENLGGKGLTIPEALEGETVLQGWLIKRGSNVKNLKKRYFTLSRGRIDYYHDLDKMKAMYMELGHKGSFPLVNAAVVYSLPTYQLINGLKVDNIKTSTKSSGGFLSKLVGGNEEEATEFGFCVRSQGKVLMLYATSKESMEAWMKGITRCNVHDPEDVQFPIAAKDGFMVKQTGNDSEKKLRYVVLYKGKMLYYEDSADEQVKVTLALEDVRVSMEDDQNKFQIATKQGLWIFELLNNYEATHWVAETKKCVTYSPAWQPIQREGWMVKFGRKSADNQTRRYFVLYNDSLGWYNDESLTGELGRWSFKENDTNVGPAEDHDQETSFKLSTTNDALIIVCKNGEQRKVWMEHIEEKNKEQKDLKAQAAAMTEQTSALSELSTKDETDG
mmetsp:Transcript_19373/g.23149  ORF Transcript_19373/g.23149 Transcript_19373/m.23149 type:complete len:394 (+) Transcript_19373:94-1275(+)|eukprot:CAMPEP_0197853942 /NCGR_PEP_ID=MMETSP1438-20131217/23747_1 /TAXON_ID=1461541 /ORGANISM="Pterosperma sp., Strain CCMP1384" /LENGTH=393 /DNA_ID=CAMNT_0043468529 /DNA_START=80 /DNA_END=1261 /DNA_ORIENTATION=+